MNKSRTIELFMLSLCMQREERGGGGSEIVVSHHISLVHLEFRQCYQRNEWEIPNYRRK